ISLAVPVPGHEGVADREVPDHDVAHRRQPQTASDQLRTTTDAEDGGVRGDVDHGAEGESERPAEQHDRRLRSTDGRDELLDAGGDEETAPEPAASAAQTGPSAVRGPEGTRMRRSSAPAACTRGPVRPAAPGGAARAGCAPPTRAADPAAAPSRVPICRRVRMVVMVVSLLSV